MFGTELYLTGEVFGLAMYKWIDAVIIFVAIIIAAKIAALVVNRVFKKIAERTANTFDDAVMHMVASAIFPVGLILGLYFAFHSLGVQNEGIIATVNTLLSILVTGIVALIIIRFVDVVIKEIIHPLTSKTDTTLDDQLIPIIRKGSKALIAIFALMVVMDTLGFDITALIAGLGVGGLALAFAARESIANLFGGISLILDKTIRVGDKIELESGVVGVVAEIGLRSTRIRSYDNEEIIVPNAQIANSRIKNYARPEKRTRSKVEFTTVYGSDVDEVKKVVLEEIKKNEVVLEDPKPNVIFYEMADFSLKFKAYFWVKDFKQVWKTKLALTQAIYNRLNKEGIGIPFPTQTIYLKKD